MGEHTGKRIARGRQRVHRLHWSVNGWRAVCGEVLPNGEVELCDATEYNLPCPGCYDVPNALAAEPGPTCSQCGAPAIACYGGVFKCEASGVVIADIRRRGWPGEHCPRGSVTEPTAPLNP